MFTRSLYEPYILQDAQTLRLVSGQTLLPTMTVQHLPNTVPQHQQEYRNEGAALRGEGSKAKVARARSLLLRKPSFPFPTESDALFHGISAIASVNPDNNASFFVPVLELTDTHNRSVGWALSAVLYVVMYSCC